MKKKPILTLLGICVLAALACEIAPTSVPTTTPATAVIAASATASSVPLPTAAPSAVPTEIPSPVPPTSTPAAQEGFALLTAENITGAVRQSLALGETWISELVWPAPDRAGLWLPEQGAFQEIALQPLALSGAPQPVDIPGMVMALAPDGSSVAAQGGDGGVIVMNLGTGDIQALDYDVAYGASYDPSGELLAVFSPDQWSVTLFDLNTGEAFKTLTGFETAAPVYSVYLAGRSSVLWVARATAQFSDVQTGLLSPALGYMDFINALAFSTDGEMLAVSAGFRLDLIPVPAAGQPAQPVTLLDQSVEAIYGVAFSPDGRLLAAGQGTNLRVWDVQSHAAVAQLPAGAERLRVVSFSPDGTAIVALDNANVLHVWRVLP